MKAKINPTITVIIATYNSENTIERCLASIRNQEYPQDKMRILIADGGSTDTTLQLVKKYDVAVINVPKDKQNAEYNKGVAVRRATGDLLLMVDHDNVLPHKQWIKKMVQPLLENDTVVAVETLRYHYDPNGSLLDRYFALYGAGDPLAFYLGKADRLSHMTSEYNLFGRAVDKGEYYIVTFKPDKIPTLGANGFLIRRKVLEENAKIDEDHFFHIDVNVDLIKKGFNTYAFTKDDIIHLTGYKNISSFLYRRKLFMEQYHIKSHSARRYSVYMPQDKWRLLLYILYAATFIKPTLDALRGYVTIRDGAWFLHPFLSFSLLVIYSYVILNSFVKRYF